MKIDNKTNKQIKEVVKTIASFDLESTGMNPFINPVIQVGVSIMQLLKIKGNGPNAYVVDVIDKLNVCIKMDNTDVWEERCLKQFWNKIDPDGKFRGEIKKQAIEKKEAAKVVYDFFYKYKVLYPDLKWVSDNPAFDLSLISYFILAKYNYPPLHFITFPLNPKDIKKGGKYYCGFGLDSDSFLKGICRVIGKTKDEYKKSINLEQETNEFLKTQEKGINFAFKEHSAIYDALKIGFEYLYILKHTQ